MCELSDELCTSPVTPAGLVFVFVSLLSLLLLLLLESKGFSSCEMSDTPLA